jgi:single-strand DNA-binding protein
LFVTVSCWGRVVAGTSAALVKGDPVIVVGHIHTSEYDDRDGNRRSSIEVRATAVGPDLARCGARLDRRAQAEQPALEADGPAGGEAADAGTDEAEIAEAMPLTA